MIVFVFIGIYIGCIGHALWTDATRMKISNSVSILLIAAFLLFAAFYLPTRLALTHIAVSAAIFVVMFCCFALRLTGGGDVKLLSAISMWIGPTHILPFLMAVALLGGLLAAFVLCMKRIKLHPDQSNRGRVMQHIRTWTETERVPYALAIGTAALFHTRSIFAPWL
ncbi:MAG: A24 family peptidase [Hyphomicrobiaceae bacterium]